MAANVAKVPAFPALLRCLWRTMVVYETLEIRSSKPRVGGSNPSGRANITLPLHRRDHDWTSKPFVPLAERTARPSSATRTVGASGVAPAMPPLERPRLDGGPTFAPPHIHSREDNLRWLAVVFALIGASPAYAVYINRVIPFGGKLGNQEFLEINPDCSAMGFPTIRVTTQPTNGVVTLLKGKGFPRFPSSNPRSACNTRRVPAIVLEYRPSPGFVGSDTFTLDAFFHNGGEENVTFNVTVK